MFTKMIRYTFTVHSYAKAQLRSVSLSVKSEQKVVVYDCVKSLSSDIKNEEWLQAKPFDTLPGPTIVGLIRHILPGGDYHNINMIEFNRRLRSKYGDIYRVKGLLGKKDVIFTYNPHDFEIVYRNEGIWPWREGLNSLRYYREKVKPQIFHGLGGVVSEQGKSWYDMRSKVNPVLMKVQNIRQNLEQVDLIAQDFLKRIEDLTKNGECLDLYKELKKWSFESISYVALNRRMGLVSNNPHPEALKLVKNMEKFFHYCYVYDVSPSIWPYYQTSKFKGYLKILDEITDICVFFIEEAKHRLKTDDNDSKSVLAKLLKMDKQVALVMVMDMLMAGIDTTSAVATTLYYQLATNPDKQSRLREEILEKLPTLDSSLTIENTQNFPYLRACFKEALRIMPITPCNIRRTTKDLVLSGYRIPAGIDVLMGVMDLSNSDTYFPSSGRFIPERWLKNEAASAMKSKNPFAYAPFGFGPRTCIGKRIAELEVETLTARLLREYHISWEVNHPLKYTSNIITVPCDEIKFKFEKVAQ